MNQRIELDPTPYSAPDPFKETKMDIRTEREEAYGLIDQFVVDSWMKKIKPTFKKAYALLIEKYEHESKLPFGKRYLRQHLADLQRFRISKVSIGWELPTDKELDSPIVAWKEIENYPEIDWDDGDQNELLFFLWQHDSTLRQALWALKLRRHFARGSQGNRTALIWFIEKYAKREARAKYLDQKIYTRDLDILLAWKPFKSVGHWRWFYEKMAPGGARDPYGSTDDDDLDKYLKVSIKALLDKIHSDLLNSMLRGTKSNN